MNRCSVYLMQTTSLVEGRAKRGEKRRPEPPVRLRVLVADEQEIVHWGFRSVLKDWSAQDLASAARMVALGMTVFAPDREQPGALLSERERQVLHLIALGSTNREIAERLFLSPHTVKDHTSTLYRKVKAKNRADAIQRAQRLGLLS